MVEDGDDEEVEWWGQSRGSRGGDEDRIKASWVSIRWLEAAREDSSGSREGDRLHGRLCIPLASQKQYWSQWEAHTARRGGRLGTAGSVRFSFPPFGFYPAGLHLPLGGAAASL